mgnify:CR=1 FL=1|tara:strand:+ start:1519 stop:3747 length:2229 start_codon:yes stop_codon:yes gene_type:complete
MKKIALAFIAALFLLGTPTAKADEGMWLPMFLKRLNYVDMQKQGLQLTPEEIYSVNNSSLKDAIVRLGGGFCTGEIISDQGLMLTNHHCGFSVIQENSTKENNYLKDGFWAMKKADEIPAGFSVSFLVKMEDVTDQILPQLGVELTEGQRAAKADSIINAIEEIAGTDNEYDIQVKSFYNGNEYYMFIYETFGDVRFVGAPPSSIGKYGGDTDNWMWPRHTGDFTLFRVYADADNKPTKEYSEDNKPYTPKHSLPVNIADRRANDYSMIFGYPGSTDRYLSSYGVEMAVNISQPATVKLRRQVLDIYEAEMAKDEQTYINYADKQASVANYWKYFKGQTAGLKRLKIYDKKKAEEDAFVAWTEKDSERKEEYKNVISNYDQGYQAMSKIILKSTYDIEAIYRIESVAFAWRNRGLLSALNSDDDEKKAAGIKSAKERAEKHFKEFSYTIDKQVFVAMMKAYSKDIPAEQQPKMFKDLVSKFKGDFNKMADKIYSKSIFTSSERMMDFLEKPKASKIEKDYLYQIANTIILEDYFKNLGAQKKEINEKLDNAGRLYLKGIREMNPNKAYAPDANSTMRVTYGSVKDYYPRDAVYYNYYTTIEGIMEKEDPKNPEFIVPAKLKELYTKKDYGQYANSKGEMIVNFISNNDITGGNSGSPVINGRGELIGTAFDGNWEAMSGDIAFETELQRTISVDIRYTLFIIDKYAGAKHLIDEMKIITELSPNTKDKTEVKKETESMKIAK